MGRKSGNITMQLNKRIDDLLRIGEKKVKDDPTNSNRVEGIHSVQTASTYRAVAKQLGEYLKEQGVRNIGDIDRTHIAGFMTERKDLSAFTHSKDLSAINKILDTRYTVREFGLPQRSYHDVSNNRGLAVRDTSGAERNREALSFVRACGMRRESIDRITPSDFLRDKDGLCVGVHLIEKGGRERMAVIIEQDRERITEIVNRAIEQNGEHQPFLKAPDSNANPHYERREYAERLYTDLINAKESGFDYYANMREHFIDERNFERATYGRAEIIKGFERDTLAEVSQNLGHNRISVVYYSYLNIA